MLKKLNEIPWRRLSHAYGTAGDVPKLRVKNEFFTLTFVISPLQASEITALNYGINFQGREKTK